MFGLEGNNSVDAEIDPVVYSQYRRYSKRTRWTPWTISSTCGHLYFARQTIHTMIVTMKQKDLVLFV